MSCSRDGVESEMNIAPLHLFQHGEIHRKVFILLKLRDELGLVAQGPLQVRLQGLAEENLTITQGTMPLY